MTFEILSRIHKSCDGCEVYAVCSTEGSEKKFAAVKRTNLEVFKGRADLEKEILELVSSIRHPYFPELAQPCTTEGSHQWCVMVCFLYDLMRLMILTTL